MVSSSMKAVRSVLILDMYRVEPVGFGGTLEVRCEEESRDSAGLFGLAARCTELPLTKMRGLQEEQV